MLRYLIIPLGLLGVLIAALAWSGEAQPPRADLAFVNRGDHNTLDLNSMSYMQDIRVAYGLWEGLYAPDPVTFSPVLGVASAVDISPDGKVYTFHLRPEAKWSNGDPLVAGDFIFEWRRMLESPREYTYLHHYIKGAEDYEKAFQKHLKENSPPPDFSAVGELSVDDHTLRIELANPLPFFPALCAFPPFFPMHERSMAPFKDVDPKTGGVSYRAEFTRPPNLVTNGQYKLDSWTFRQRFHMVANPYYWNASAVQCKTIDEIYADAGLAAYRLYQQGAVDWLTEVDPDVAAPLVDQGGRSDLHVFPVNGTYFYELNCLPTRNGRPNPLADVRVRRALAMAVDRTPIVRDVTRLGQPESNLYIPAKLFAGYTSPPGLPYDVAAARKLLAEAGYPGGAGFPPIKVLYNSEGVHADIATVLRSQWKKNLGLDFDVDSKDSKQYSEELHKKLYDIARAGWFGDYDDPSTFTDKYLSTSENNAAGWKDAEYDELCRKATLEPDAAARLKLLAAAENRLLNEAPIIPLYTQVASFMISPKVRGIPLVPAQMVNFKSVVRDR